MNEPITLPPGALIGQIWPVGEILSIAQENNHPLDQVLNVEKTEQNGFRNKYRLYAADGVQHCKFDQNGKL